MALTAYSGVTNPQVAASTSASASAATTAVFTSSPILLGDRFVVFTEYNSSTASVSSITNTGTALVWTRLGSITTQGANRFEIWYSSASTGFQRTVVTVTYSVAVTAVATMHQITGFPGVPDTPVVASGNSTTPSSGGPTPTAANALLLWAYADASTSNSSILTATPAGTTVAISASGSGTLTHGVSWSLVKGIPNAATRVIWNNITSGVWFSAGVSIPGPTVSMDDLTFIMRDDGSGVLLNNPAQVSAPIYEVNKVTGLDNSTINSSSSEIDGAHGSYMMAKFLKGKTVAIDCTLYSTVPVDEAQVDFLKYNYRPAPNGTPIPFFYKLPGKAIRWIATKPLDFQCDMDPMRSIGVIPFQVQFGCPDPRSYSLPILRIQNTPTSGAIYDDTPVIGGNIEAYPVFYFTSYAAEVAASGTYLFTNFSLPISLSPFAMQVIVSATLLPAAGQYVLDFGARSLTRVSNGQDCSSAITTRNWWWLVPGVTNNVQLSRIGAGVTNDGFAMSYADAYR